MALPAIISGAVGFAGKLSPKHLKMIAGALVVVIIVTFGYFGYRYVSGMNDTIAELTGDLATTQMSLNNAQTQIDAQEESLKEIGLRVQEVNALREKMERQQRINQARIDNLIEEIGDLRSIEDVDEFSQAATESLERRIKCLGVAAGTIQLGEGETCDE